MSGFGPTRDEILRNIRDLADSNGGVALGRMAFAKATGITENQWLGRYWTRWGDAVQEAGFEPNALQGRFDTDAVLTKIATLAREIGHFPTIAELKMARRDDPSVPSHNTFTTHFGGQSGMARALRDFCARNDDLADVRLLLPEGTPIDSEDERPTSATANAHGWVYLICSGAHYKVGRSDQLERRIKEIKVALPEAATLVHAIETDDPAGIEAYWHRRFGAKRANGEWFRLDRVDVAAFRRRRFQ